jgi:hypothetical protein
MLVSRGHKPQMFLIGLLLVLWGAQLGTCLAGGQGGGGCNEKKLVACWVDTFSACQTGEMVSGGMWVGVGECGGVRVWGGGVGRNNVALAWLERATCHFDTYLVTEDPDDLLESSDE